MSEAIPLTVAQCWLWGSQFAVKKLASRIIELPTQL